MSVKNTLIKLGRLTCVTVLNFARILREIFALATNAEDQDERRIVDSEYIGDYNDRTGRLDAGTDPYGWYDEN